LRKARGKRKDSPGDGEKKKRTPWDIYQALQPIEGSGHGKWIAQSRETLRKKLASPAWHGAVLKEREAAYAAGKLTASDWEQAKKRIKKISAVNA